MPRVQALVVRDDRVLMVKHRQNGEEWWCLPGGGLESGETPQEGVLRELREECQVEGKVLRQTSRVCYGQGDEAISFLVDIGDQEPSLGHDPEVEPGSEVLTDVRWMKLCEISERDRVFLWAAGLLGVGKFLAEVDGWKDERSYPGRKHDEEITDVISMKDDRHPREVSIKEHYDLLIDENIDPVSDNAVLTAYMSRWDGPLFFKALGPAKGKKVLEVGIGTGRIAKRVLEQGCELLVGVDFSPKTIERARENLSGFDNVEFVQADMETEAFARPNVFDCAYSVLTFMHFRDKQVVLSAMVDSIKPGGHLVISVTDYESELVMGDRKISLHISPPEDYIRWLTELGCEVDKPVELIDDIVFPSGKKSDQFGELAATLIKARRK